MNLVVTDNGDRPAGDGKHCFYCDAELGTHMPGCVCLKRSVVMRAIIEYVTDEPAHWDHERIEFARNESSSCNDNVIAALGRYADQEDDSKTCFCSYSQFAVVREATPEDHVNLPVIIED